MATPANYLDNLIADQQSRRPAEVDVAYWANRYLFVPFRDRELTMELMGSLGLPEFKAGLILPITRFRQQIVDNTAVQRVPVGYDGRFVPVGPGIEEMKLKDRAPSVVFDAIMRIFNPDAGVDPAQDSGIREVVALRGNEDFDLLREIQRKCLPDRYTKVRAQLSQLASVALGRPSVAPPVTVDDVTALGTQVRETSAKNIFQTVAQQLWEATETSFTWARWHYHTLQSLMENQAKSGKERLSPLDAAVCEWIEMPEPRYQSRLASNPQQVVIQQAVAPATAAPVWCANCGATTNYGPAGQLPRVCPGCLQAFTAESPAAEVVEPESEAEVQ